MPAYAHTRGRPPELVAEAVHRLATSREHNARALFYEDVLEMPKCDGPLDAFVDPTMEESVPAG